MLARGVNRKQELSLVNATNQGWFVGQRKDRILINRDMHRLKQDYILLGVRGNRTRRHHFRNPNPL